MPSPRDPDATRSRILAAAAEEFAALGIAGARVDRIAAGARANKALIYRYFGDKDGLFDAVFSREVVDFVDAVAFDAEDLPGYAGRLFDRHESHPRALRLTHWYQLERPHGGPLRALVEANDAKLAAIREAQRRGAVPATFSALQLLALVRSIAMSWHNLTPELGELVEESREVRRVAVVDAVRRLLA